VIQRVTSVAIAARDKEQGSLTRLRQKNIELMSEIQRIQLDQSKGALL